MKKLLNTLNKQEINSLKKNPKINLVILKLLLNKLCIKYNIPVNKKIKLLCFIISQKVNNNKQFLKNLLKFNKTNFLKFLTEIDTVLYRTKFHYGDRYGILVNLYVTKDSFQENLDKKHNQKSINNDYNFNELYLKKYRPDLTECFITNRNPYQINQTKKKLIYTVFGNYYKLFCELNASLPLICHRLCNSSSFSYKNYKHILPKEYVEFLKKKLSKKKKVLFYQILIYGLTVYENQIIFCRDIDKLHRIHLIEKPNKNKECLFLISSNFSRVSQLRIQNNILFTNCKLISLSSTKGITNNISLIINHQSYYLNNLINNLSVIDYYKLKLMQYQHTCKPIIRLDRNGLKMNKNKSALCKLCFEAARKIYMEESIKNECYKIKNCLCSELFFGSFCTFGTRQKLQIEV